MDLFRIKVENGKLVVRNLTTGWDTPGMSEVTVAVEDNKVVLEGVFQFMKVIPRVSGRLEDDEVGSFALVQKGAEKLRSEAGQGAVDAMCDGTLEARRVTAEDLMACPVDPARALEEQAAWEDTQRRWDDTQRRWEAAKAEAAKAEYEQKRADHDLEELRKRDPEKAAEIVAMQKASGEALAEEWKRYNDQQKGEQMPLPLEKQLGVENSCLDDPPARPLRQGSRVEVLTLGFGWYSGSTVKGPLFKLDSGLIVESWKYRWRELPR